MSAHVLSQLNFHRTRHAQKHSTSPAPPLIVGVQGPQGSGKTFLTAHLRAALQAAPNNLSVAVLSLDDLYLPHAGLVAAAAAHPHNALLQGRGQPGTHDVPLGTHVLRALAQINDRDPPDAGGQPPERTVELPSFDKSLFGGEGDRARETTTVRAPLDVVLFEGWCTGFCPISREKAVRRCTQPVVGLEDGFLEKRGYRLEDILEINGMLKEYVSWWEMFDTFIQVRPGGPACAFRRATLMVGCMQIAPPEGHPYTFIYKWRVQQEHHMKARNGGKGMSDEQIQGYVQFQLVGRGSDGGFCRFVDRYIPGYVFFGGGVTEGYEVEPGKWKRPTWSSRGLRIRIGESREVIESSTF